MKPSAKRARTTAKRRAAHNAARRVKDLAPTKNLKGGDRDPSGNTIYVGGANGGVWKTTNG